MEIFISRLDLTFSLRTVLVRGVQEEEELTLYFVFFVVFICGIENLLSILEKEKTKNSINLKEKHLFFILKSDK